MFIISAIETSILKKINNSDICFFFTLLVLVPLIGIEVKGAKRWLDFYFLEYNQLNL